MMSKKSIAYSILPKKLYFRFMYKHFHGISLNLGNPERFTEKLWWLKKYYHDQWREGKTLILNMQQRYDKYRARQFFAETIGEKYLTKLYGVYNDADDIKFEELPEKFVLKVTQSCGSNIICFDKKKLNMIETRSCMRKWLDYAKDGFDVDLAEEKYLIDGKAVIICEELLTDVQGKIPHDLRFYCFNGEPEFITIDTDAVSADGKRADEYTRNTFDKAWREIPVAMGRPRKRNFIYDKPDNLDEMLDISRRLSSDYPFVRVDMYNIEGRIVIGEITWIPQSGYGVITPLNYDYEFGKLLQLPRYV